MQVLGHNCKWNLDAYLDQGVGDCFLIPAYTHGQNFKNNRHVSKVVDKSMIDLQFYGQKESKVLEKGKLQEFNFHPAHANSSDLTNVYMENCIKRAVQFQSDEDFQQIIIPNSYEDDDLKNVLNTIKSSNNYVKSNRKDNKKYYMTLVFPYDVIIDVDKVEEILFTCTDMDIDFDGFFVVCETKFGFREKVNKNIKVIRNLSRVFKTLKNQGFETIYGYANWDAILYLAQTNIDYVTIGTYENSRKFDIKRYTQNESGGKSDGYYFSEKLLNMIRPEHLTLIRETSDLNYIANEKNIFSEVILQEAYAWNAHKPDVNKNYLLAADNLLRKVSNISDLKVRLEYVRKLIDDAIRIYQHFEESHIILSRESSDYHLSNWKAYLGNL